MSDQAPTTRTLRVEDHAFATRLAEEIVLYAQEREWLAAMDHHTNQLRHARGYPLVHPLTDRERAEGRLYRIGLHIKGHL